MYRTNPWYTEYFSNNALVIITAMLVLVAYQICRTGVKDSVDDETSSKNFLSQFSELQDSLNNSKSFQDQRLDEISKKLASFDSQIDQMTNFADNLTGTLGKHNSTGALKSKLRADKSPSGSKKNVRFAEGF